MCIRDSDGGDAAGLEAEVSGKVGLVGGECDRARFRRGGGGVTSRGGRVNAEAGGGGLRPPLFTTDTAGERSWGELRGRRFP